MEDVSLEECRTQTLATGSLRGEGLPACGGCLGLQYDTDEAGLFTGIFHV